MKLRFFLPSSLARLSTTTVLGKSVQDPEVPTRLSGTLRLHRGRAGTLPNIFSLVQHRASSFRHRTHATRRRALRTINCAHRATRPHARCRLRRPPVSLQGYRTAPAQRAARRMDQSAQKGNHTTDHHTQLLVKLVNKCVSSSLTCSGITLSIDLSRVLI